MTEEQVEKHGDVIKWFCDNPKKQVWRRSAKKIHNSHMFWTRVKEPNWYTDEIYVQDDKYAELRKAQVDGKIIQSNVYKIKHGYSYSLANNWDGDCFEFVAPLNMYRIKPDEPKFKVGDWIKDYNEKLIQIKHQDDTNALWIKELWEPKNNEWNIFWNDNTNYVIDKLYKKDSHVNQYVTKRNGRFTFVAPLEFVQHLKDNQ